MSDTPAPKWTYPVIARAANNDTMRPNHAVALAAGDEVLMAWVPSSSAPNSIYWSTFDPTAGNWSVPKVAVDTTNNGMSALADVALCTLNGKIAMAWTAVDKTIVWSEFVPSTRNWQPPVPAGQGGTPFAGPTRDHGGNWHDSPSIAETFGRLFLAWMARDGKLM